MPTWSTACPDWADRLRAGQSIIPPPIYPAEAEQALAIFKALRVVDLPFRPTFGECSDQWVFDFVAAVFGGYDSESGNQLIREFYLLISKKNTKSTIAAGIMLTATILCWRDDEEHLILAPTKEVADNSFKPAASMVRADAELADLFDVQPHLRTITHRVTKASLKVVAADSATVSGKKSGKVFIDEHHEFGKVASAEAMFTEALGGQASRNEGWVIKATTQSGEPPAGVFLDALSYMRQVRDGKIHDPRTLPILFEFPDDIIASKGYLLPENWRITNPNLGRSVSIEWLAAELEKKRHLKDGGFQQVLAKHLNVQIGLALRSDRWAGADFWEQNAEPALSLDDMRRRCEVICGGVDGGGLDDLLALALVGREAVTGRWLVWVKCWAHPSVLERRQEIAPRLQGFAADGDLGLVETIGDDIDDLVDILEAVFASDLLDRIGVDPAGIGSIVEAIEARGISAKEPAESNRIIGISQGWRLAGAIKTAERKLLAGELRHGGRPLMAWQVGNARVEPRANSTLITKQASGTGKIDGLMAVFNAVSLLSLNPAARLIGAGFELMTV